MKDRKPSRRRALKTIGGSLAAGAVKTLPDLGGGRAQAGTEVGARAVVLVYLFGGNDSNNVIVPRDSYRHAAYLAGRGNLALPQATLLPVQSGGQEYGFHPALSELRDLYERGVLTVVANVGPLEQPTAKAQYADGSARLPPGLMTHGYGTLNFLPGGFTVPGWATALGRLTAPSVPTRQIANFLLSAANVVTLENGVALVSLDGMPLSAEAIQAFARGFQEQENADVVPPATGLSAQLSTVARLIEAAPRLGMKRQVFCCSLNGFDTHSRQSQTQTALFRELSLSLASFYQTTVALGISHRVTTYTDSEFNRSLVPNALGGTEHGWGGQQLVMGDAVLGGDIHGEFPSLMIGGPDDATGSGVWIPTISQHQYEATMARWLGVSYPGLHDSFPGLSVFSKPTIGFLA